MDYNRENFDIEDNEKTSKINSGGLINLRIHNLWEETHKFASVGNFSKWNVILDRIWCELVGDAKDEDVDKFNSLNSKVIIITNLNLNTNGFSRPNKEQLLMLSKQYKFLMDKEKFLRRLLNEQGKGTAYTDGSESDWE